MRKVAIAMLVVSCLPLGGCLVGMAASAVGAAVNAASGGREIVTDDLRAAATQACRARGAREGEVQILDAEQVENGTVTVWGILVRATQRRSFECVFRGGVRAFKLREIRPQTR